MFTLKPRSFTETQGDMKTYQTPAHNPRNQNHWVVGSPARCVKILACNRCRLQQSPKVISVVANILAHTECDPDDHDREDQKEGHLEARVGRIRGQFLGNEKDGGCETRGQTLVLVLEQHPSSLVLWESCVNESWT